MAYSTHTDIILLISKETLLQLCDDDNVGDIVVEPANTAYNNIVAAIAAADSRIDSYIGAKYTLPLDAAPNTPASVKDCSANLALCNLFDRRREMDVPEGVERRRKEFTTWLRDVQAGRATIPEIQDEKPAGYAVSKTEADRTFTSDLLNQY